ncbi:MAG TPA: hypothetical protein VNE62_05885 [Actinomycetota bacterium]|nr:hypothetical protein [Actinomycetota bacterium]
MRRLRGLAGALLLLGVTFLGAPAQAADVSHESDIPRLEMSAYFSDDNYEVWFTASSGLGVRGSANPPSVTVGNPVNVSFSVLHRETNTTTAAHGPAVVAIDPALNAGQASGTITNGYGTFVFSVTAAGTGAPSPTMGTHGSPEAGAWVYLTRQATTAASISAPNGTYTGVGSGYMSNRIGTYVRPEVP